MPTDSPDLQSPPARERGNHVLSWKHPILPTFPCLLKVGAELKMGLNLIKNVKHFPILALHILRNKDLSQWS